MYVSTKEGTGLDWREAGTAVVDEQYHSFLSAVPSVYVVVRDTFLFWGESGTRIEENYSGRGVV